MRESIVTEYICECCDGIYTDKELALQCEQKHVKSTNLVITEVHGYRHDRKFPAVLDIQDTESGAVRSYRTY